MQVESVHKDNPRCMSLEQFKETVATDRKIEDILEFLDPCERAYQNTVRATRHFNADIFPRFIFEQALHDRRATKLLSRKQRERFASQLFVIENKASSLFHLFRPRFVGKKLYLRNHLVISAVSTPRGRLYQWICRNELTVMMCAHFFDRLSQRHYDSELDRMQAIHAFVERNFLKFAPAYTFIDGYSTVALDGGIGLGFGWRAGPGATKYAGSIKSLDFDGVPAVKTETDYVLLKTFISDAMATSAQLKAKKTLLSISGRECSPTLIW